MRHATINETLERFHRFRYQLILEGVAVGILSGLVVVLFRLLLEHGEDLRQRILALAAGHPWGVLFWLFGLALAAVIVCLLLRWEPYISGSGIPQVEAEMLGLADPCWWRVLLAKISGGLLSVGCGLSLGREGPSIQLGAMAAKGFSRLAGRSRTEERILLTCGAGAGLAAAFNAPFAGVLFALEEIHKNFTPEILLSAMSSAIAADFVSRNVFGLAPVFNLQTPALMPLGSYWHMILLGLLLGALGVVYNRTIALAQDLYQHIPTRLLRLLLPFLTAGALGFLFPAVLGGGHQLVQEISAGSWLPAMLCLLFVVKFLFSMLSFGSGAPGGIFLPLLVLGALIGAVYYYAAATFLPLPEGALANFIILGMAGYFSAIVRAPITGIILISEMTGSFSHLLTLSIVSLCAYLVPDLLHCPPIYDQLRHRMLLRQQLHAETEKVLVTSVITHGAVADGRRVSEIEWPAGCLVVSLIRDGKESIPKGDTRLQAEDRILLLCDEAETAAAHEMLSLVCESICEQPQE